MSSDALANNPSLDLANALSNLPDVYLRCRGIQHVWNLVADMHITELTEDGHVVERHLQCTNCECIRKDKFLLRQDRWQVNRLEVLHPTYAYPDGYLVSEMGHVEHPREVLRFELLTRALGGKGAVNRAKNRAKPASDDE